MHELLLEAGPPPELTPALAASPETSDVEDGDFSWLPRRRWRAGVVVAFAAVAAAFGLGYLTGAGGDEEPFPAGQVRVLQPTDAGPPTSQASIRVGRAEDANAPMLLTVRGLRKLGARGYYELLFTRNGKVVGPCGTFNVRDGSTTVYLNAPYEIDDDSGWAIAIHPNGHVDNPAIVMKT